MPDFIHGKELSRRFYNESVKQILAEHYPALVYSAGLWGYGSEVLGFDTPMSRDHDWGPRLQIFLSEEDRSLQQQIWDTLAQTLPKTFYGYSTHFGPPNEEDKGTRHMSLKEDGPVDHRVQIMTLEDYLTDYLPVNVLEAISPADWLIIPQQRLRTIVAGGVFHDGLDCLLPVQEKLHWYPDAVWFYLLASGFSRIGQEEHLMGRCGYVGDEIGSAQLGAHLTRTIMLLTFWMEKSYAPYHKWFGTSFKQLDSAEELLPTLHTIRLADTWQDREKGLETAYLFLLRKLNSLKITAPVEEKTADFFGRPFRVIYAEKIANQLKEEIKEPLLANLPLIGNIDLVSSSTDVLENNAVCAAMKALYVQE